MSLITSQAMLKPGWTKVKFGEVVRLCKEKSANPEADGIERYVGLEHIEPEDLRIRRWGLVAEGTTFTSRFKPGQVLFGKRRAYQRKVAVADFEGVCSGDIYVFESANPKHLLPELLPFICQTEQFFNYAVETSMGSLSPRTNWKHLEKFEFHLPSIDEQRKYIRLLQSIELTLDMYLELSQYLAQLYKSYIFEVLHNYIEIYPQILLEEVADVQYGLTVNKKRRESQNKLPYLRVANVQREGLDLAEIKLIGTISGDENYRLEKGDVLIVEGHADPSEVGRAATWLYEDQEMLHQNHLIRVRASDQLLPDYLTAFINSPLGQSYFRSHAKSTSGLNTLNSTVVRQLKLPLPTIKQQASTVQYCQKVHAKVNVISERIRSLNIIKSKLIQRLENA